MANINNVLEKENKYPHHFGNMWKCGNEWDESAYTNTLVFIHKRCSKRKSFFAAHSFTHTNISTYLPSYNNAETL